MYVVEASCCNATHMDNVDARLQTGSSGHMCMYMYIQCIHVHVYVMMMMLLPSSTTEERLGAHVFFRVIGGRCGRDMSCRTCCTRTPRWGVVLRLSLRLSFPLQLRCYSSQPEQHSRPIVGG